MGESAVQELDELERRGRALSVEIARLQAELADVAGRVAQLEDSACLGVRQWLSLRCGLSVGEARRCARLAERLPELSAISTEFSRGALSEGVADLLCEVATRHNQAEVLEVARTASGGQLSRLVRDMSRVREITDNDLAERERVSHWTDPHGLAHWSMTLLPERSAQLDAALRYATDSLSDPETGWPSLPEALEETARMALQSSVRSDGRVPQRYMAQVLVDIEDLDCPRGQVLGEGPLSRERLAAVLEDSWVSALIRRRGTPLWTTSPTRFATDAQFRALLARDRTCAFPGCGRSQRLKAHHITHYSKGGPTRLSNLVLLCQSHHTLIHKPGWNLLRDEEGTIVVSQPNQRHLSCAADNRGSTEPLKRPTEDRSRYIPNGDRLTPYGRDVILQNWLEPPLRE